MVGTLQQLGTPHISALLTVVANAVRVRELQLPIGEVSPALGGKPEPVVEIRELPLHTH
jgi:hypothetical protein